MMMLKVIVEDEPNGVDIRFGYGEVGNMTDREKELITKRTLTS